MNASPRRIIALSVLIGLVAVAAAGASTTASEPAAVSQSTIVSEENSTNYLMPVEAGTERYESVDLDASTAVSAAVTELQMEHDRRTFEQQRESTAETESEVAESQLETVRDRLERLDNRQEELFRQYSAGVIESKTLLRELIEYQSVVESQMALYEELEPIADPPDQLRIDIETLGDSILPEQPVVDRVEAALLGESTPLPVTLQSGENALVLATVDSEEYYRQATLRNERDIDGEDQFGEPLSPIGYGDAQQRTAELYPWAYSPGNLEIGGDSLSIYSQIYQMGVIHDHGQLTLFFDGATRNVFHENQLLLTNAVSLDDPVANTTGPLTAAVETTRAGGPMRLTIAESPGSPADISISVDGQSVGTANEDGTRWLVQPGGSFIVTVTTPAGEELHIEVPG